MPARPLEAPAIPLEVIAPGEPPDLGPLLADTSDPEYRPWSITSRPLAEWAMTRLAEAQAALAPIREKHAEWRRRLAEVERAETAELERQAGFFAGHLQRYAAEERAAGHLEPGATLSLANGHVDTIAHAARITVPDRKDAQAAAVEWVRANWPKIADKIIKTVTVETVPVEAAKALLDIVAWPVEVVLTPCEHRVPVGDGLAGIDTGELFHPLTLEAGRGVICPECSAEALVAYIGATRIAAVDADGREPAGIVAVPATITATVHPEKISPEPLKVPGAPADD